jgi:ParB family chromosome partitioning protein
MISTGAEGAAGAEASLPVDAATQMKSRLIKGLAEELQKLMGTKVSVDYSSGKGKVSIHFYSDEELTQIVDLMKEAHGN